MTVRGTTVNCLVLIKYYPQEKGWDGNVTGMYLSNYFYNFYCKLTFVQESENKLLRKQSLVKLNSKYKICCIVVN